MHELNVYGADPETWLAPEDEPLAGDVPAIAAALRAGRAVLCLDEPPEEE